MTDTLSQTINFDDKHVVNASNSNTDPSSLLIHIDNNSEIPVSVNGNINTTLSGESAINKISELGKISELTTITTLAQILELTKISELTKITEPVEIRNASTDLDMLKDVALQLYTYADFEKIKNRVDYGVLCFDRAYDYVRAYHIFLDRSRKKHFYFKIYDANPEIITDAADQTEEKYTELQEGVVIKISYDYYKKNIINQNVKHSETETFKTFMNGSNIIECKLSRNNITNITYTVSCKGYKDLTGNIPDDSLDSVFEVYLEKKTGK